MQEELPGCAPAGVGVHVCVCMYSRTRAGVLFNNTCSLGCVCCDGKPSRSRWAQVPLTGCMGWSQPVPAPGLLPMPTTFHSFCKGRTLHSFVRDPKTSLDINKTRQIAQEIIKVRGGCVVPAASRALGPSLGPYLPVSGGV